MTQIATFTGHSRRDVDDAHDLARDVNLAEIAVMKLEMRTKPSTRCAVCSEDFDRK